jgi:hypothetical protein
MGIKLGALRLTLEHRAQKWTRFWGNTMRHNKNVESNGIRVERPAAVNLTSTPDEGGASSARDAGGDQQLPDAWSTRDD